MSSHQLRVWSVVLVCLLLPSAAQAQELNWTFIGPDTNRVSMLHTLKDGTVLLLSDRVVDNTSYDRRAYRSSDGGETWLQQDTTYSPNGAIEGPQGFLIAFRGPQNVSYSTDDARSWSDWSTSGYFVSDVDVGPDTTFYYSSPYQRGQCYNRGCLPGSGGGLHARKLDSSWREIGYPRQAVRFSLSESGRIFVLRNDSLAYSDDQGGSWDAYFTGIDHSATNDVLALSKSAVLIVTNGVVYYVDIGDGEVSPILSFAPVSTPTIFNPRIYVSQSGIYLRHNDITMRSADGGRTWNLIREPDETHLLGVVETRDGYLLASTSKGVYRTASRVVTSTQKALHPENAYRLVAAPNPSSSSTSVTLHLGSPEHVTIEVFDVVGRLINLVHSGLLRSGPHAFMVALEGRPSGVYFCRVRGEAATQTLRLYVLR